MKKVLSILILGIFLISLASASSLPTQKQNDCVELYQLCESCTFVNLTSVNLPNETRIFGQLMNNFGNDFTFEFCNTSLIGEYQYNVCGDKGGTLTCENIGFEVTKSGFLFNTSDSILSILMIILTFILSVVFIWLAIVTPLSNNLDEKGNIIKINYFKYLKIFSVWFAHIFLVYFLTTFLGIMNNFYTLEITVNLVEFLYRIIYGLLYPMTLLILGIFIIFSYKDILWNKQIREHGKAFIK